MSKDCTPGGLTAYPEAEAASWLDPAHIYIDVGTNGDGVDFTRSKPSPTAAGTE